MPPKRNDLPRIEDRESDFIHAEIIHPQGTHSLVFSNSIGQAILILKEKFNYQSNEEAYINTCNALRKLQVSTLFKLNEIPTFLQAEWDSAVETLLARTLEPTGIFDTVTLAIPVTPLSIPAQYHQTTVIFPLKEIVPLVWQGLNNSTAYVDHYTGSDKEKLEQAEEDKPARIRAFFRILQSIQEGICHHGVRNELILSLNKTHQGISIIESAEGVVLALVKDTIHTLFWDAYAAAVSNTMEKKELLKALTTWMSDDNPSDLLKLLDPKSALLEQLNAVFYDHGTDPSLFKIHEMTLEEYVVSLSTSLAFNSDMSEQNPLHQLHVLLRATPDDCNSDFQRQSLNHMQNWIKNGILDIDVADHRGHLCQFYQHHVVNQALIQYGGLLEISGYLDAAFLQAFNARTLTYFRAFSTCQSLNELVAVLTDEFINDMNTLFSAISRCQSEKMLLWVERFFSSWFRSGLRGVIDRRAELYQQLINPTLQKIIKLSEMEIQRLDGVSLTLELSNRIFLMAILTRPEEWTEQFAFYLDCTINFAKSETYPVSLIEQLNYLNATYRQHHSSVSIKGTLVRPADMLLLPEDIRTFDEWKKMMGYLEKDSMIYLNLWVNKKNRIIQLFLNDSYAQLHEFFLVVVPSYVDIKAVNVMLTKQILSKTSSLLEHLPELCVSINQSADRLDLVLKLYRMAALLHRNHQHLLTYQNVSIFAHEVYPGNVSAILLLLLNINPTFFIDDALFKNILSNSNEIKDVLLTLIQAGHSSVYEKNFKLIVQSKKHMINVARGLSMLYRCDPFLINDSTCQVLANNASEAWRIAMGMTTLYTTHPTLLDDDNCKLLEKHPKEAEFIALALKALFEESPDLVNAETREVISLHYNTARMTARSLVISHRSKVYLASITQAPPPTEVPFYPSPLHEQNPFGPPHHPIEMSMTFPSLT